MPAQRRSEKPRTTQHNTSEIQRLMRVLTVQTVGIVSLTLFLTLTAAGWFIDYKNEDNRLAEIDHRARSLIVALEKIMRDDVDGKHDQVAELFSRLKSDDEFLRLGLLDNDGVVAFSNDAHELGRRPDIDVGFLDEAATGATNNKGIQRHLDRSWDRDNVQYIIPIVAEADCRQCHDDQKAYRGAIVADYTLRPIRATMWHFRFELALMLLVVAIVFAGLLHLILKTYTYGPLRRIAGRLQGIATGEFHDVPTGTESGIFAFIDRQLDRTATQLKRLHSGMEKEIHSRTASLEESRNQLAEQTERMSFLLDRSPAGIVGIGPDNTVHITNQRALETLNLDSPELTLAEPLIAAIVAECGPGDPFATVGSKWDGEVECPAKRFFEFHATTLNTPQGDPLLLMMFTESTERHDTARRHARQERLAATGQLAAGVAHEIGNPLAAISSIVQLVTKQPDEDHLAHYLDLVTHHLARIQRIVADMTAFARIPTEVPVKSDINDVVGRAIGIASFSERAAAVAIEVEPAEIPPVLTLPSDRLEQAILNIAMNAFDAMAGQTAPRLCVEVINRQHRIDIVLQDNGPGIPAEIRERIFEPFFTTKPAGQGTGLGLSVTYRAILDMGGSINLVCPDDGGTIFTIGLPKGGSDA